MAQFYTVLTQTGQAKMANALALGTMIEVTQLAVGDGGGSLPSPDSSRETLINEVRRASINRLDVDPDNPSWLVVEQVLPPEEGGWTIREVGVIDADGDLIGYGNYPETYKPTLDEGSGRTQTIRMVLEVSDTAAVTLKVDPSVVLATREHVAQERAEHEAGREHPASTESLQGMIKRASQAKALAGEDNADAMTALRVFQAFSQYGVGGKSSRTDWNLVEGGGFNAENLNGPFGAQVVMGLSAFHHTSTAYGLQIAARNTQVAFRTKENYAWQSWFEFFHTGNRASQSEAEDGALENKVMTPLATRQAMAYGMAAQNCEVHDAAGTLEWSVPQLLKAGIVKARVTVIGGGGGGRSNPQYHGGGGAGGIASTIVDLTGVTSVSITVGTGGAGGTYDTTSGSGGGGGTSSFGAYLSATGGGGGGGNGIGGAGGTAAGDNLLISSSLGDGQSSFNGTFAGNGGGPGGRGQSDAESNSQADGRGYGGGGGGAGFYEGIDAGSGAAGAVIIEW